MRAAVDANRREAVCETLARLDSTQDADMQALFSFERLNETLPPRFGYYVGYLVAAEAGKTRSLQHLATLGHDEVRPLVEARLRGLKPCPSLSPTAPPTLTNHLLLIPPPRRCRGRPPR